MSSLPGEPAAPLRWYIGLMSGTSLDGIDGVIGRFSDQECAVAHHASAPFAPDLRAELLALNTPGPNELHRAALAGNALARAYAAVVDALLKASGLPSSEVNAIGAHGQTVRHQPALFDGTGYTLQIGNAALLAECTGIPVVADFRSRDLAAGGQGAPLVPAFHQRVFGKPGETVCVLNVGGISNLSILEPEGNVRGFDCGPGNALMDHWCLRHTGRPYDDAGAWAATGAVLPPLLEVLLAEPFLRQSPPKSTGRDLFNADWLTTRLAPFTEAPPPDVQATLTEFTARACARDVERHAPSSRLLIVCGGGAFNTHLMDRLRALLPSHRVESSALHGLPPLQVEAAAFAWLARQAVERQPGNLPSVTGAQGLRVLGAIHPA
ncbi:anhydro-N-acetylmuramic acid kinase [Paracidovorax anthurii]|uniref:Anhydro-N-acetylmuramic acid kinase n=1 Tax=Paracidovorax anthurii TaxID=78229 RepID=A0A328YTG5_9BURK|nr:anhydro-N-acetylmuramic acid kinase [Paracidovorax anthurii]RAR77301.1 anhydro-N-acetylmuramic acid kinase [Paracidovorax anthurii]